MTSPFSGFNFAPSANDAGTVAFAANLVSGERGLFIGDGVNTFTVYDSSTPSGGFAFDFFDDPSLNNFDMMAFRAFLDTGEQGIFAGDGFMTSLIADSSTFTSFNNPAINNVGMVVFHGTLATGEEGIFLFDGVNLITVADNSLTSPFASFEQGVPGLGFGTAINDAGVVSFFGELKTGERGIYTAFVPVLGPPVISKVIQTGDPLDGSTALGLTVVRDFLNDRGEVAFRANLFDGRFGIYRASVPEPSTVLLLSLGLTGLVAAWWKKRK